MTTTHIRSAPAAVVDLRGVVADLYRRRLVIMLTTVACVLAAVAVATVMPPRYVAQTKVLIDPQGLQVLPNNLNPAGVSSDAVTAELESQVQVFTSTEVLGKVIDELSLADDPEFDKPGGPAEGDRPPTVDERVWRTLRNLRRHLDVRRPDRTQVIDLSVWTSSPDKSQRIADAIAKSYLDMQAAAQAKTAGRTADALDAQLTSLRSEVTAADAKVKAFRDKHDLLLSDGRLISEKSIEDLNKQILDQRAKIDALTVRPGAAGDTLGSLPEALQSPAVTALRTQYATAVKAAADNDATLGPRNPTAMAGRAQVQELSRQIALELGRVRASLDTERQRATLVERNLLKRLDSARQTAAADRIQLQTLHDLENEATGRRTLLDTVERRAKEVRREGAVDKTNARVISPAALSPAEYAVPRALVVAGGLAGGLLVGFFLAALLDVMGSRPRGGPAV